MEISSVQKVWDNSNALCICIPKNIVNSLGLEKGDLIHISWNGITKKAKDIPQKKIRKKELPEL